MSANTQTEREPGSTRVAGSCEVTVVTDRPAWDVYLSEHLDATLFHDPRWGEVMRETYGNRCHYLTALRGGQTHCMLLKNLRDLPPNNR